MAEYPPDTNNIPLPVYPSRDRPVPAADSQPGDDSKATVVEAEDVEPVIDLRLDVDTNASDLHRKAGIGIIQQQHSIPATGKRMPTSKWEYIFFCIFCESPIPVA